METKLIREAIENSILLEIKNKELTAEVEQLIAKKGDSEQIAANRAKMEINTIKILAIRASLGSFYTVWDGKLAGDKFLPHNVVSLPFSTKEEAEDFIDRQLKPLDEEEEQTRQFSAFSTTMDASGKFIGHY